MWAGSCLCFSTAVLAGEGICLCKELPQKNDRTFPPPPLAPWDFLPGPGAWGGHWEWRASLQGAGAAAAERKQGRESFSCPFATPPPAPPRVRAPGGLAGFPTTPQAAWLWEDPGRPPRYAPCPGGCRLAKSSQICTLPPSRPHVPREQWKPPTEWHPADHSESHRCQPRARGSGGGEMCPPTALCALCLPQKQRPRTGASPLAR